MLLINPRNRIYVNAALDHFGQSMNSKSLRELYNFYTTPGCEPVFNASHNYYTIEESVELTSLVASIKDVLSNEFYVRDGEDANDSSCFYLRKCEEYHHQHD